MRWPGRVASFSPSSTICSQRFSVCCCWTVISLTIFSFYIMPSVWLPPSRGDVMLNMEDSTDLVSLNIDVIDGPEVTNKGRTKAAPLSGDSGGRRGEEKDKNNNKNTQELLVTLPAKPWWDGDGDGGSSSGGHRGRVTRKLPQALIIGVKKCGTRALLEFIRLHPDVRAVGPETHFFDRHYQRGLEWYRRQMPPTLEGQLTMEKTPSYFVTKEVPRRVYSMSKDVKLLVVVRDPVTRAISDYAQTVSKRHHMKAFDELAYINNVTGLVDTSWGAIRIGVYAKYLERWLKYFSRQQLHFVSGEGLIRDPAGEMAKVQDFLGIRRIITDNHFYFNETKGFPCVKKSEKNGSPKCLGRTKGRTHPSVDNSTIRHLRDFFRPFNRKFYQMTGVDFGWP